MTDELRANDNAISLQAAYESGRASRDAEVEALKRDAERYRWLRVRMSVHRHQAMPDRYGLDEYFLSEGIDELNDDQYLDTAIDAAMAKESGE